MTNCNHRKIVYVPACMLCPSYQADVSDKKTKWAAEFKMLFAQMKDVDIVSLPCPEYFYFRDKGIVRTAHGIKYYESLYDFLLLCDELSKSVINDMMFFQKNGNRIVAVCGIEHSPTCAVNYMYTNKGTIRRRGIFFERLSGLLSEKNIVIPFVGINRNFYKKAIDELNNLTHEKR